MGLLVDVVLIGLALLLLGKLAQVIFQLLRRERYALRARPVATGKVCPPGPVSALGDAWPLKGEEPLSAPLSGTPCLAWDIRIWYREELSNGRRRRVTVFTGHSPARRFVIDDGSGPLLIVPGAGWPGHQRPGFTTTYYQLSPEQQAFVAGLGFAGPGPEVRGTLYLTEALLTLGQSVSAIGEPGEAGGRAAISAAAAGAPPMLALSDTRGDPDGRRGALLFAFWLCLCAGLITFLLLFLAAYF